MSAGYPLKLNTCEPLRTGVARIVMDRAMFQCTTGFDRKIAQDVGDGVGFQSQPNRGQQKGHRLDR
jgi:hypothetical protein